MTQNHHADTHIEAARLRRMAGRTMDSFGEIRYVDAYIPEILRSSLSELQVDGCLGKHERVNFVCLLLMDVFDEQHSQTG